MNWGMMTKAERDAAYNNSDAVKNSAELNAARIAASEAFRRMHPKHLALPNAGSKPEPILGDRLPRFFPGSLRGTR